jgi:hypothetical protein
VHLNYFEELIEEEREKEQRMFKALISSPESFKQFKLTEPKFRMAINDCIMLYRRNNSMCIALEPENDSVLIAGDTHGDTSGTIAIISEFLKRIEKEKDLQLIFLGDYVDRGYDMLKNLYFVAKIKVLYPKNVHLLRGNHESHYCSRMYDRGSLSSFIMKKFWKKSEDKDRDAYSVGSWEEKYIKEYKYDMLFAPLPEVADIRSLREYCSVKKRYSRKSEYEMIKNYMKQNSLFAQSLPSYRICLELFELLPIMINIKTSEENKNILCVHGGIPTFPLTQKSTDTKGLELAELGKQRKRMEQTLGEYEKDSPKYLEEKKKLENDYYFKKTKEESEDFLKSIAPPIEFKNFAQFVDHLDNNCKIDVTMVGTADDMNRGRYFRDHVADWWLLQLLWNDPAPESGERSMWARDLTARGDLDNARGSYLYAFSKKTFEEFMSYFGFSHLIRAHEIVNGVRRQFDDKCITITTLQQYSDSFIDGAYLELIFKEKKMIKEIEHKIKENEEKTNEIAK